MIGSNSSRPLCVLIMLVLTSLAAIGPRTVGGQLIQFDSEYLAFEAEDFALAVNDSEDRGWRVVDVETDLVTGFGTRVLPEFTNAAGGEAVFDQNGNAPDYLQYQLEFLAGGDYHLYLRYSTFERGNNVNNYFGENSIYASSVFGVDGLEDTEADPRGSRDVPMPSLFLSFDVRGAVPGEDRFEGRFEWWNAEADETDAEFNPDAIYSVDAETAVEWGFSSRETHVAIDRVVFHKSGDLLPDELDRLISSQVGIPIPADFNGDLQVDFGDFLILSENFSESFAINDSFSKGDQTRDGRVDLEDFLIFREMFLASRSTLGATGQPISSVPEPATWLPMLFGLLVLLRRRHI